MPRRGQVEPGARVDGGLRRRATHWPARKISRVSRQTGPSRKCTTFGRDGAIPDRIDRRGRTALSSFVALNRDAVQL
jgi:hypothetical protein